MGTNKFKTLALIAIFFLLCAWTPWDQEEADQSANCSGVYGAASYAIRTYKYKPPKGQNKKDTADYFQRLSNILRYFATNSGYEDKMRKKVEEALKEKKAIVDEEKDVDALYDDIQACDLHLDVLYESYAE